MITPPSWRSCCSRTVRRLAGRPLRQRRQSRSPALQPAARRTSRKRRPQPLAAVDKPLALADRDLVVPVAARHRAAADVVVMATMRTAAAVVAVADSGAERLRQGASRSPAR